MKRALAVLAALSLIGLGAWQISGRFPPPGAGPQGPRGRPPVAVEVAPVGTGDIREVGRFTGTLHPRATFMVAPKIAGRLERIAVDIGDRVAGGQLVAVLDDEELRRGAEQAAAELEVARANLQERESTLENAGRERERSLLLREKRIASASELDAAEAGYRNEQAKLRVAVAQVAQREAALQAAQVRLSYAQVRLPAEMDGQWVVGERFVDRGALLAANAPIVTVLDIGNLTAVVNVTERDYPRIAVGLAAAVAADAFPGRTFPGRVSRIAPLVREESREARVEIAVPNPGRELRPGMFVEARLEFGVRPGATVVPAGALVKRDGTAGVFLADLAAGTAAFVPVTAGIGDGTRVEILSPPLAGTVVTLGQHLLEDGAPILVPGAPATPGP